MSTIRRQLAFTKENGLELCSPESLVDRISSDHLGNGSSDATLQGTPESYGADGKLQKNQRSIHGRNASALQTGNDGSGIPNEPSGVFRNLSSETGEVEGGSASNIGNAQHEIPNSTHGARVGRFVNGANVSPCYAVNIPSAQYGFQNGDFASNGAAESPSYSVGYVPNFKHLISNSGHGNSGRLANRANGAFSSLLNGIGGVAGVVEDVVGSPHYAVNIPSAQYGIQNGVLASNGATESPSHSVGYVPNLRHLIPNSRRLAGANDAFRSLLSGFGRFMGGSPSYTIGNIPPTELGSQNSGNDANVGALVNEATGSSHYPVGNILTAGHLIPNRGHNIIGPGIRHLANRANNDFRNLLNGIGGVVGGSPFYGDTPDAFGFQNSDSDANIGDLVSGDEFYPTVNIPNLRYLIPNRHGSLVNGLNGVLGKWKNGVAKVMGTPPSYTVNIPNDNYWYQNSGRNDSVGDLINGATVSPSEENISGYGPPSYPVGNLPRVEFGFQNGKDANVGDLVNGASGSWYPVGNTPNFRYLISNGAGHLINRVNGVFGNSVNGIGESLSASHPVENIPNIDFGLQNNGNDANVGDPIIGAIESPYPEEKIQTSGYLISNSGHLPTLGRLSNRANGAFKSLLVGDLVNKSTDPPSYSDNKNNDHAPGVGRFANRANDAFRSLLRGFGGVVGWSPSYTFGNIPRAELGSPNSNYDANVGDLVNGATLSRYPIGNIQTTGHLIPNRGRNIVGRLVDRVNGVFGNTLNGIGEGMGGSYPALNLNSNVEFGFQNSGNDANEGDLVNISADPPSYPEDKNSGHVLLPGVGRLANRANDAFRSLRRGFGGVVGWSPSYTIGNVPRAELGSQNSNYDANVGDLVNGATGSSHYPFGNILNAEYLIPNRGYNIVGRLANRVNGVFGNFLNDIDRVDGSPSYPVGNTQTANFGFQNSGHLLYGPAESPSYPEEKNPITKYFHGHLENRAYNPFRSFLNGFGEGVGGSLSYPVSNIPNAGFVIPHDVYSPNVGNFVNKVHDVFKNQLNGVAEVLGGSPSYTVSNIANPEFEFHNGHHISRSPSVRNALNAGYLVPHSGHSVGRFLNRINGVSGNVLKNIGGVVTGSPSPIENQDARLKIQNNDNHTSGIKLKSSASFTVGSTPIAHDIQNSGHSEGDFASGATGSPSLSGHVIPNKGHGRIGRLVNRVNGVSKNFPLGVRIVGDSPSYNSNIKQQREVQQRATDASSNSEPKKSDHDSVEGLVTGGDEDGPTSPTENKQNARSGILNNENASDLEPKASGSLNSSAQKSPV